MVLHCFPAFCASVVVVVSVSCFLSTASATFPVCYVRIYVGQLQATSESGWMGPRRRGGGGSMDGATRSTVLYTHTCVAFVKSPAKVRNNNNNLVDVIRPHQHHYACNGMDHHPPPSLSRHLSGLWLIPLNLAAGEKVGGSVRDREQQQQGDV